MDKIVCVGKNYLEHAKELGDAVPEKPVLFLKPPSVLLEARQGASVDARFPMGVRMFHHECEIVLRLGKGGYRLSPAEAASCIAGVSLGLDMTLRDLQSELKKKGHPWTTAKVFPDAAIVGPWIPVTDFPRYLTEVFTFSVEGKTRQTGVGEQMLMKPADCLSYISEFFPLCAGDLVYTGTPAGVGSILAGQQATLKWGSHLGYSVRWHA